MQETSSTETESSETPKEEKSTEESAEDGVKSEEKKPETGSSETPQDEKSAEKNADDNKKGKVLKNEGIKTEEKSESKSQDSTENESSDDTSAKETEEKKSDDVAKVEEKVEEKTSESSNSHDVYTGEVHDPNINSDERHNYRPINIMFRRKCQNPHIRIQFDRTVILKNQTFYLNVDGKNVRLVASPQSIETFDDIKTLLQIVDHINLSNCCVEPISHIS